MMNFVLFLPFFGLELSTEVGVEFSTIDCKCNTVDMNGERRSKEVGVEFGGGSKKGEL
jgi:hypothetical protein